MGAQKAFYRPEKLVVGVLSVRPGRHGELERELSLLFGRIEHTAGPFPFTFTDYYVPEMGSGIMRSFYVMQSLVSPDKLAEIKASTNELENLFKEDGDRKINLDPGLLGVDRFVLATTKDRGHRMPLRLGIFGEVTLIYRNGGFQTLPWTYADFATESYREFLKEVRQSYLRQLRLNFSQI